MAQIAAKERKTFYFATGVNTAIYPNSPGNIPFDCDNVPERAKFEFACDSPQAAAIHLIRGAQPEDWMTQL